MKIGFISCKKAPYRNHQLNEFSKLENVEITAYYTHKENEGRSWTLSNSNSFSEVNLKGIKISKKYGYINKGIIDIVKKNDFIIIGGYQQPTYLIISYLCKIFGKKYIILFDGISTDRLYLKDNKIKFIIKQNIVKNSTAIMANGTIGRKYFETKFNYPSSKIYNQYLAIDYKKIEKLYLNKEYYREKIRNKLGIHKNSKVVLYSGRLIDIKNVESVIKAVASMKDENIVFLIAGGGILEESLRELAKYMDINLIITGFISKQEELFEHYFAADIFILPSKVEAWGLVVNEAMNTGLPVLVSDICGCSLDLVKDNGYLINPNNIDDIKDKLEKMLYEADLDYMGKKSKEIISRWTFENSRINFQKIIGGINE